MLQMLTAACRRSDPALPHLVAGCFDNADDARLAMCKVRGETGLPQQRIRLLPPGSGPRLARRPPQDANAGVQRLAAAGFGLFTGVLLALALKHGGIGVVLSHLPHALILCGLTGCIAGWMAGRPWPGHNDAVHRAVRLAGRAGHWSVLVHPHDPAQAWSAIQALRAAHAIRVVHGR